MIGPQTAYAPPPLRETRAFALCARSGPRAVYGWVFSPGDRASFKLCGLGDGEFVLTWYDPWTGRPVPGLAPQSVRANAQDAANRPCLLLDAAPALRALRAAAPAFQLQSRQARGDDAAFKLLPR